MSRDMSRGQRALVILLSVWFMGFLLGITLGYLFGAYDLSVTKG